MRTAGTEIRQTRGDFFGIVSPSRIIELRQTRADRLGVAAFFDQDIAQFFGNHDRIERVFCWKQLLAVHGARTALVPAIDPAAAPVVKDGFLDLDLNQLALFLDHHDQVQPLSPSVKTLHIHRPCLAHFIGGDAQALGHVFVDIQKA